MNTAFNLHHRKAFIEKTASITYDIIIIGGGITGAGILLDAASRGLKACVIEKEDFAAGTSSRSTKLIHGGLRYLKQLEVGLVREVGMERAIVFQNARHVVHAEKMLLPIVQNGSLGKGSTSFGLKIYDFLAGVKKAEQRVMLSAEKTLAIEPLLRTDTVIGGGLYYEYRTDDARLTTEILKTAFYEFGADAINHAQVQDLIKDETGKVVGVSCVDLIENTSFNIQARFVVNAAGPWVDELRKKDNSLKGKRLKLSKGVHIVVDKEKLPLKQSVYFDVEDGRMMFAIPRQNTTYIGTTDTFYEADALEPSVTKNDVQYILDGANKMFPTVKLTTSDVLSTWSGVRPLIYEEGKAASELSRKDEIFVSTSGLISIAGGKLTGYRKMAERTVDLVFKKLQKPVVACLTKNIRLWGGKFSSEKEYTKALEQILQEAEAKNISKETAIKLFQKYGTETSKIISSTVHENALAAEIAYAVEHEMVCTLSDFIIRRSGMLYFERPTLEKKLPEIKQILQQKLHLSDAQIAAQEKEFLALYEKVATFI